MYDPYAEFTKTVLSNGAEAHSTQWKGRPWIIVKIVVHCGGREDTITMPGIAHFVEHVVSENIPEVELDRVKEFFETVGGSTDFGSTDYHSTEYKFGIPADPVVFQKALTIFGSMLINARLEKNIERERNIINREFNLKYSLINELEWDMGIRKVLFKKHRLETWNRPLGRPEGFLSVTAEDLQVFYDKYYVPSNISLAVVGSLSNEEVIASIEKSPFGMGKIGLRNLVPQQAFSPSVCGKKIKMIKMSDYFHSYTIPN